MTLMQGRGRQQIFDGLEPWLFPLWLFQQRSSSHHLFFQILYNLDLFVNLMSTISIKSRQISSEIL